MLHEPAAYGIYPDNTSLNEVFAAFSQAGFSRENICMMLSPTNPIATIVRDSTFQPFERENNVITAGLIGWLSEFGAVVIPTVGFFIRSREFFRALVSDRASASGCGLAANLASLGFSGIESKRLEKQFREFGVLLYIACQDKKDSAVEILRSTGAENIGCITDEVPIGALPARCAEPLLVSAS